jgi:hypothetical protein
LKSGARREQGASSTFASLCTLPDDTHLLLVSPDAQFANLVVLTGPAGSATTAYDGDISGAVIAGECWLNP